MQSFSLSLPMHLNENIYGGMTPPLLPSLFLLNKLYCIFLAPYSNYEFCPTRLQILIIPTMSYLSFHTRESISPCFFLTFCALVCKHPIPLGLPFLGLPVASPDVVVSMSSFLLLPHPYMPTLVTMLTMLKQKVSFYTSHLGLTEFQW